MISNTFKLELLTTHWISEQETHRDLCAHGQVRVIIGDEIVSDQTGDEGWTISTTALLLLRTLQRNHTKENPVGDQLIPCCGHFFVFDKGMYEVYIGSCPTGINWEVKHNQETVRLETERGTIAEISFLAYKNQVLDFVDKVEQFYNTSPKKNLPTDEWEKKGYLQFWKEWHEIRSQWDK